MGKVLDEFGTQGVAGAGAEEAGASSMNSMVRRISRTCGVRSLFGLSSPIPTIPLPQNALSAW